MQQFACFVIAILLAAPVSPSARKADKAAPADTAIRVSPVKLTENRTRFLSEGAEENASSTDTQLLLTLHVEGGDADRAHSYGKIKIEQAIDDLQTNLKPDKKKSFFSSLDDGEMQPVHSSVTSWADSDDEEPKKEESKGFDLELSLALPPRKAERIARLKGKFDVLIITDSPTVRVSKLGSLIGKPIEDKALEAVQLKARILKPGEKSGSTGLEIMGQVFGNGDAKPESTLRISFEGNVEAIKKTTVVDVKGKSVVDSTFSSGVNNSRLVTHSLKRAIDEKMVLKIELIGASKTFTVPFDLKDLPLP